MVHNIYREAGGEDVVFENEKRLLQRNGHIVIPYVRSNLELQDTVRCAWSVACEKRHSASSRPALLERGQHRDWSRADAANGRS
jgi:hypothetical protein